MQCLIGTGFELKGDNFPPTFDQKLVFGAKLNKV